MRIGLFTLTGIVLLGASLHVDAALGQEKTRKPAIQPKPLDTTVAAKVNGEPIFVREVERELRRALGKRPLDPQGEKFLRAQTLEQLIGQRVVLRYLASKKVAATKSDVDLQLEKKKKELKQQNVTLPQWLAAAGEDEPGYRRTLAWKLSWQGYLDQQLSDENLKKFFDKHPRDFDGSQVRASHILFKVDPAERDTRDKVLAKATKVREEITSGKLTFAQAAQMHSAAPTAAEGGEIGLISRHEPMPEQFSKAAFELAPQEVSQPVVTTFGVHLVTCLEVKPGTTTWQDARGVLSAAVTRYLFDWIVGQERPNVKVEYTSAAPHFAPGTQDVVD